MGGNRSTSDPSTGGKQGENWCPASSLKNNVRQEPPQRRKRDEQRLGRGNQEHRELREETSGRQENRKNEKIRSRLAKATGKIAKSAECKPKANCKKTLI